MSGIANLFNVPGTLSELASWASAHMTHHRDINKRIHDLTGLTLPEYVLDPINPDNTGVWERQHQIMHQDMDALLQIEGFDLSNVDFKNQELLTDWIQLNANEHYQADDILRVSVPVLPTQVVESTFRARSEITSTAASYSFAGLSFGPASDIRYIVACLSWQAFLTSNLVSGTIGGVAATVLVQTGVVAGRHTAIMIAAVPLGTTGAVAFVLNGNAANAAVAVYSLTGIATGAASSVASSLTNPPTVAGPVQAFGTVIAVATGGAGSPPSATWAGLTENCDNNYGAGSGQCRSAASENFDEFQESLTITCTFSVSTSSSMCAAVFNP